MRTYFLRNNSAASRRRCSARRSCWRSARIRTWKGRKNHVAVRLLSVRTSVYSSAIWECIVLCTAVFVWCIVLLCCVVTDVLWSSLVATLPSKSLTSYHASPLYYLLSISSLAHSLLSLPLLFIFFLTFSSLLTITHGYTTSQYNQT